MSHFIADAIRAHIGSPQSDSDRALLAIVDKCERMRAEADVGMFLANEFEGVIVRALNVAFPIDQAAEANRLLGH